MTSSIGGRRSDEIKAGPKIKSSTLRSHMRRSNGDRDGRQSISVSVTRTRQIDRGQKVLSARMVKGAANRMHTRLNKEQPLRRRYGLLLAERTNRREEDARGASPTEGRATIMPEQEHTPPIPPGAAPEQGPESKGTRQAGRCFCRHGVSARESGSRRLPRDGTETVGRPRGAVGRARPRGPPPVAG
jgi:hypothetical protein